VITGVAAGTATITYTVAGTGGCADAAVTRTVTVTAPPIAGKVSGDETVAPFTSHTYSIAAVSNAQVYKWILPSGWTGTSDKNSIDIQSGSISGEITVQVTNTNGCLSNISKIMVIVDARDTDDDGVPDLVEDREGTSKNDAKIYKDTDKDGVPDYVENVNGTSATNDKQFIDSDAGGTPDYVESKLFVAYGLMSTDPNNKVDDNRDTDEDKTSDYQELLNGTNPNDAPANLLYSPNAVIVTIGNPININAPTYTAGKPKKYSISPVLPTGVIFNETTGVISGTPTVLSSPAKQYTITATNGGGSTTGSFTLTVIDIPPTNLRYNPNSQRATRNVAINNMLPSSSGGAVVTYSISPSLPAGLTLNTSTGIISGTLTAVLSGTVQYTIRATNTGGSTTVIVTLVYNTPPSDIALSRSVIYEGNAQGDQIGNLSTTDIDPLDTHTYTLVNGAGSDDNASFTIAGNQLRAAESFVFANKSSYTVRVRTTDNGGLFFEKVFIISILELPSLTGINSSQFNGGPSPNPVISRGFSTQLSIKGTDIVSVLWTPSTGLSATNILNPIARPTVTTTYTVTIRNAAGAVVVMKVTVEVKDDYFVEPANILTPNRDGINDFWIIKNLESYPQNEILIFDRNGKMLYKMTNYNNRWDGRLNGKPLITGTYYYILRFPERPSILHKGFITIIQ
jgi:gliding motility-associated-like protein